MRVQDREIVIGKDYEETCGKAADFFRACAARAIGERGKFSAALSGGSTPKRFFEILGAEPFKSAIQWKLVHFFWGDERCVPPDSPDSNYKMAYDLLISKLDVPESNIHRMKGEIDPQKAAAEYEAGLRTFACGGTGAPRLDFILLGMGPDGHTASLFPGTAALEENERLVISHYVEKVRMNRLTFTFPEIDAGRNVVFLVSGSDKAGLVSEILSPGENEARYPAARVRPDGGKLFWFIDAPAAEKIRQS